MHRIAVLAVVLLVVVPFGMAPLQNPRLDDRGYRDLPESQGAPGAGAVLEERDDTGALVREVVYVLGRPAWQVRADGSSHYLLEDARGSIVALIDGATALAVERVTYDPFGRPVIEDPDNQPVRDRSGTFVPRSQFDNSNLFDGLWYEPELGARTGDPATDRAGLYRLGRRRYNPDEGRYTTRNGSMDGDPDRPFVVGSLYSAEAKSQASRRYLYFAKVADVEGYPDIAGNFRDTADGETGHAHGHLDFLKNVGDPSLGAIAVPNLIEARKSGSGYVRPEIGDEVVVGFDPGGTANDTGGHEVGHWLGLYHTFDDTGGHEVGHWLGLYHTFDDNGGHEVGHWLGLYHTFPGAAAPQAANWQYGWGDTLTHEGGHWLGLYHTFDDTGRHEVGHWLGL